jgi:hypothetical protein
MSDYNRRRGKLRDRLREHLPRQLYRLADCLLGEIEPLEPDNRWVRLIKKRTSIASLVDKMGMCERTICRQRAELVEWGAIRIEGGGGRRKRATILFDLDWIPNRTVSEAGNSDKMSEYRQAGNSDEMSEFHEPETLTPVSEKTLTPMSEPLKTLKTNPSARAREAEPPASAAQRARASPTPLPPPPGAGASHVDPPPGRAALAKGSAQPGGSASMKPIHPQEIQGRLYTLCQRLNGAWPAQKVRHGAYTISDWLPEIDVQLLRDAIADHVRVDALAKGLELMLAENVVDITPTARIVRAIEIARARQAAYKPKGQGYYSLRKQQQGR